MQPKQDECATLSLSTPGQHMAAGLGETGGCGSLWQLALGICENVSD